MTALRAVRLRPAGAGDARFLEWMSSPEIAGPYNSFGDEPADRLTASDVGAGKMIIERPDGTAVGDVSYFGVPYGPNLRSLAWRIGCTVAPAHRGQGFGSAAQAALADHLFATTVSNRVEADTDLDNIAERTALQHAGFTFEGVVRQAQFRRQGWFDRALYGRLRGDPSPPEHKTTPGP